MIELAFLKELILIKQVHQKTVIFVTIGTFRINGLSVNRVPAIYLDGIAALSICSIAQRCIISGIGKSH